MRNNLYYTYPHQSLRCDHKRSFVELNRYLLARNDSRNYRHITDAGSDMTIITTNCRYVPVNNDSILRNCVCDHNVVIGEDRCSTDCYALVIGDSAK